jgi:hypothetical protein
MEGQGGNLKEDEEEDEISELPEVQDESGD